MRSLQVKRGFTLIELLVVIAIIAILASILFPVFAKAREKARQTTCLSQVRQMATACQMYNQDNNGRFPGVNWADGVGAYLGNSQKMFFCPSDAANDSDSPISYGFSGLLVRADGTGVNEAQIKAPTEVGVICDAQPAKAYPNGGLVGGGALQSDVSTAVVPAARHSNGTVVGYADGHAKYCPKGFDEKDMSNGVTRAFFMANALGLIDNPAGGLGDFTYGTTNSNPITLGGDACVGPIIVAAAEAWKKKTGAAYYTKGFTGMGNITGRSATYVWGRADGTGGTYPVAQDALVFITAKTTKIPSNLMSELNSGVNTVTTAQLMYLFGASNGYSANAYQAYTYDTDVANPKNGNEKFVLSGAVLGLDWSAGGVTAPATFGSQCITAANDVDMVDKVANDPYGIGYCSSAMADPERVQILGIKTGAGVYSIFPNANPKYRWTVPATLSAWPFIRTLYVDCAGLAINDGAGAPSLDTIGAVMFDSANKGTTAVGYNALTAGSLFKCSYFAL